MRSYAQHPSRYSSERSQHTVNIQRNEFSLQVTCLPVCDETVQLESSPLIVEVSRSHTDTHTYTRVVGLL